MPDVQHTALAGGIFHRLDAEWSALCADHAVQCAVADWMMADGLADDIIAVTGAVADAWVRTLGPAQLLAALRPGDGRPADELTDAVLRALLRRAAGHGRSATLAARIIVQTMIPAAVRMARSQVRGFGGRSFDDVGHMTVAALFEVARSGRIHTRPGRPAANLALDTLRHVCRALASEHEVLGDDLAVAETLADTRPGPADRAQAHSVHRAAAAACLQPAGPLTDDESSGARLELLELVLEAMENGTLSAADARSIAWHYTSTALPDATAAARNGTTAGAWRRRRSRAVARLSASLQRAAA
ncbi:hypothetical protein [Streptomyces griseus]|uniref:hypothetical protein n=1 Tax=Streptomyces griseus TaxID=1911 RepID=UPI0036470AFB